MLDKVTPLILTYNEAPNIARTIEKLAWAKEIVVIDSYSNDETLNILKSYPCVKVFQRAFDTHAIQWNYGVRQVSSEWVLSLDADYCIPDRLVGEISALNDRSIDGYFVPFKFCVFGKPLQRAILPPRQALFRKEACTYIDDGHTQLLVNKGLSGTLKEHIYHDDRKPVNRWFNSQIKYADLEMKKLIDIPPTQLSFVDKIRLAKVIAPVLVFVYCLIYKGGILDGWHGIYYAFQRVFAELILSIKLIEHEFYKTKTID
ncbi:glycosyltransferase family 2 protein [Chamaesiphon minutus]|uniref:Glycosyl transferase n=1 Tax=Chamaesiphon minutus (strain ATCC 27169 / PCC 6605) TaxID=1173020 RepID=K9ULP3_CHAP6|nr:glycosyltransferase family 2 protein [Chamaesiphon minutus]AFY95583.1 glycosyl transferase [Chamaesiphon minutus PCC 6605]